MQGEKEEQSRNKSEALVLLPHQGPLITIAVNSSPSSKGVPGGHRIRLFTQEAWLQPVGGEDPLE